MWTSDQVLKASRAWQWIPPGAEALQIGDVPVIDYPEWARMGFYAMPAGVTNPAAAVTAVSAEARSRGRETVSWWVAPDTEPADLQRLLLHSGATLAEVADILAYDMSQGPPEIPVPDDVDNIVVTNAQGLDDAERVAAVVWGGTPSSGERRNGQLLSLGHPLDDQGGFRVVAHLDRRPFATAGCQIVADVARLYGGCVLPELRGLGGYRSTVRERLRVAHDHGARLALVHARSDTSKPILTRLGFESYGETRLYNLAV